MKRKQGRILLRRRGRKGRHSGEEVVADGECRECSTRRGGGLHTGMGGWVIGQQPLSPPQPFLQEKLMI